MRTKTTKRCASDEELFDRLIALFGLLSHRGTIGSFEPTQEEWAFFNAAYGKLNKADNRRFAEMLMDSDTSYAAYAEAMNQLQQAQRTMMRYVAERN